MRTKVTLVLLLLNAVLFFSIFYLQREWRTERAFEETRRRVLGPEVATINTLGISGGRFTTPVHLAKRADEWYLTSPIDWPANPNAVQRILNELLLLEHETSFAVADLAKNGQSLADYGLENPQLTLTFTSAPEDGKAADSGVTTTLRIGDATKIGNRLYLLSPDGTRIHVVNRSLVESLDLGLDQLRSDGIFTIHVFEARSLNLQTPAPASLKIRLRRDGPNWTFETPIFTRASKTAVELAINGLNALRTGRFEPKPPDEEQTGLTGSALHLTLEGNGRREILVLGRPVAPAPGAPAPATPALPLAAPADTEYYAKMDDKTAVFTVAVPAALLEKLRNAQEEFREKRLLDFDPRTVTSAVLAAPNLPELDLQRLETGQAPLDTDPWQVVTRSPTQGPQTLPADRERVQHLLQILSLLQAEKFQSDAPSSADLENWGFNRPDREITLTLAPATIPGTPTTVTLLIGSPAGPDGVYAKLANAPFIYVVSSEILNQTPVIARQFRDHLLRELPAGAQITRVRLLDATTKAVLFDAALPASAGPAVTWESALAGEPAERKAAALALLDQLRSLHAKRFIPPDSFNSTVEISGESRPWKYLLETTLALTSGAGTQTSVAPLYLSERAGGNTQFAGSPELNVNFEADQKMVDALFTLTSTTPAPVPANPPAAPAPAGAPPAKAP